MMVWFGFLLSSQYGLLLPKTTLGGVLTRIKRKINFLFLFQVFSIFAIFEFRKTRFFRKYRQFRETAKLAKLVPHFRETRKSFRSQFREIFAKRNFVKNPTLDPPFFSLDNSFKEKRGYPPPP
jgi:hypothetical protein